MTCLSTVVANQSGPKVFVYTHDEVNLCNTINFDHKVDLGCTVTVPIISSRYLFADTGISRAVRLSLPGEEGNQLRWSHR